jgi:hypothetical protein
VTRQNDKLHFAGPVLEQVDDPSQPFTVCVHEDVVEDDSVRALLDEDIRQRDPSRRVDLLRLAGREAVDLSRNSVLQLETGEGKAAVELNVGKLLARDRFKDVRGGFRDRLSNVI